MSQLGQKAKYSRRADVSALPPEADIHPCDGDVPHRIKQSDETTWRLLNGRSVCKLRTYASDTQALGRSERRISAYVQVFGRRNADTIHALLRPASQKAPRHQIAGGAAGYSEVARLRHADYVEQRPSLRANRKTYMLVLSSSQSDPMYGPAVRCKWILPSWR
jgi:hypothetical protein